MRDDHIYQVLDRRGQMNDIIRCLEKMPLDHLNKNDKRRVIVESRTFY
jgi:hypothetical protein